MYFYEINKLYVNDDIKSKSVKQNNKMIYENGNLRLGLI
jgi:hypothetical protein